MEQEKKQKRIPYEQYEYAETVAPNGRRKQTAYIGFVTFREAEELAKANGWQVMKLEKKPCDNEWTRTGELPKKELDVPALKKYGEGYDIIDPATTDGDECFRRRFLDELAGSLDNMKDLDDLREYAARKQEIIDRIDAAERDELVVTRDLGDGQGEAYFDTIKRKAMDMYDHWGKRIAIGVPIYAPVSEQPKKKVAKTTKTTKKTKVVKKAASEVMITIKVS